MFMIETILTIYFNILRFFKENFHEAWIKRKKRIKVILSPSRSLVRIYSLTRFCQRWNNNEQWQPEIENLD